jgi:hypothetical protein
MENTSIFMYLSVIEGLAICCMLGWEIFWLRKMYQVLWSMPTAKQIGEMVDMIKSDRDSIRLSLASLVGAFEPLKNMLNGGVMGSVMGLFSGTGNKTIDKE